MTGKKLKETMEKKILVLVSLVKLKILNVNQVLSFFSFYLFKNISTHKKINQ